MPNNLNVEEQLILALRRITRAVDIHSSSLQREFGLTGPQLTALRVIQTLQPVSAGVLARTANIGYATLTGILDRLEKQGFAIRTRDADDRRTVIVTVTDRFQPVTPLLANLWGSGPLPLTATSQMYVQPGPAGGCAS